MEFVFSPHGKKIIEALFFTKSIFAFDYDGTLSPIVKNPDGAILRPKTRSLLKDLNSKWPIGIISGRSISDLNSRVGGITKNLIGNHGLEWYGRESKKLLNEKKICENWSQKLKKSLDSLPGVELENKEYSIAIHYRKSRNKTKAKEVLIRQISNLHPSPRIIFGKCVINLVPVGAPHKGLAMLELLRITNSTAGLYIGDDDTDEDVFCLPNSEIITVRVGMKNKSNAQYFLKSQSEVNKLIAYLLKCHKNIHGEKSK